MFQLLVFWFLQLGGPEFANPSVMCGGLLERSFPSWRRRADELLREGALSIYAPTGPDLEKALLMLLRAASMYGEHGVEQLEAVAHEKVGLLYGRLFNYRESVAYCRKALAFHLRAGQVEDQARLHFYIAHYHLKLDELERARDSFLAALGVFRQLGDHSGQAKALSSLARYHARVGEPKKAAHYIEKALALSDHLDDPGLELQMLYMLGGLKMHQGMYREALATFEKIRLLSAETESYLMANVFNSMGFIYHNLGDPHKALSFLDRSAVLYERWDNHHLGLSYIEMGNIYLYLGERQLAIDFFLKAQECLRLVDSKSDEATVHYYLGKVHQSSGDHETALGYYRRALKLTSGIRNERGRALALHAIGDSYLHKRDFPTALEFLFEALAVSRKIGNRGFESLILTSLGLVYYYLERYDEAECYFEISLDLQRELGIPAAMALTYRYLCRLRLSMARLDAALCDCLEAMHIQRSTGNLTEEALTLHTLSAIMAAGGHLETALVYGSEAIEGIETIRGKIMENHLQTSFFSGSQSVFQLQIELLMEAGAREKDSDYVNRAFHVSERSKARGFLDLLGEWPSAHEDDQLQGLLRRKKYLQQRLNGRASQWVDFGSELHKRPWVRDLDQDLGSLLTEYRRVDGQIRFYRSLQNRVEESLPLNAEEIQDEILDGETALLEFALGEQKSFLWILDDGEVESFQLPGRAAIEPLADEVYGLLVERGRYPRFETRLERRSRLQRADQRLFEAASELSRMLLGQALPGLKAKRLLIVADGALRKIPFHILPLSGEGARGDWAPLLFAFETVASPSASILASLKKLRKREAPAPKKLAIFADPVFHSSDTRVPGLPAQFGFSRSRIPAEDAAGVSNRLRRLLYTRDEALSLQGLAASGGVYLAMDFDANMSNVNGGFLRDFQILHFATHALIEDANPELSSLVFSLVDEEGRSRPGFLRQHDIFNLELHAELVVLSGCRTALGQDAAGEGLIGLTRAFMCAGALRVVASLWTVQDEATAALMSRFYRNMLTEGMPPGAALREAQLDMWRSPRWSHPYYWGAFIFQGLWD